jgi:Tol biopolymer transport system component/DNA-binding winged helix-turn-helix (wHTH) protein
MGSEYTKLLMPDRFRFEEFELDLSAYELRKGAESVRLERIPFELLSLLVERRGQLVGREEIIERIWGKDVFHDTEHGINTAVRKIRQALHDDPGAPRFVVTVPAKGYRFVAPVEKMEPEFGARPTVAENGYQTTAVAGRTFQTAAKVAFPSDDQLRVWTKNVRKRGWAVAAALLLLSGAARIWRTTSRSPTVINAVRLTNDGMAKNAYNLPVTDGARLYFIEGASWTGPWIVQVPVAGGETTRIATAIPKVLAICAISPDRSELLVGSGDVSARTHGTAELWVQPLPAGTPHRIGNIYASDATWTPDGRHILSAAVGTITVANKDGSDPRQLANVPGWVRGLRFSPDGQRIRFSVFRLPFPDFSSIWEMESNGENIHQVFAERKELPYQCCGNWSPNGDYYYFLGGRGSDQAIWVVSELRSILSRTATSPLHLISGPLRFNSPVPSSDGKRLFVVGEEPRVELLRYDLRSRRFDSYLQGLSAGPFDFSPDRSWITYVSYPDMTLWRARADGTDKMQLTFPPVRAYEPRWSPNGSKIVFLDVQFYRPWRIGMVSPTGGNPELIMHASESEGQADPTWMPDGKSIVFSKFKATGKGTGTLGIYRLDLSSGKVDLIPDSDALFSPRISHDGRYIAAITNDQTKLMLFDSKTNNWSPIMESKWLGYNEWSHDGEYIYFREKSGPVGELDRVRISDRVLEHVSSLNDFPQVVETFAGWIGLTPDDAPVLIRDRSIQEIYALDLSFH